VAALDQLALGPERLAELLERRPGHDSVATPRQDEDGTATGPEAAQLGGEVGPADHRGHLPGRTGMEE
jgi:hypothetical protein